MDLTWLWVLIGVVVLVAVVVGIWWAAAAGGVKSLAAKADEAWDGLVVALEARADLLPSLALLSEWKPAGAEGPLAHCQRFPRYWRRADGKSST